MFFFLEELFSKSMIFKNIFCIKQHIIFFLQKQIFFFTDVLKKTTKKTKSSEFNFLTKNQFFLKMGQNNFFLGQKMPSNINIELIKKSIYDKDRINRIQRMNKFFAEFESLTVMVQRVTALLIFICFILVPLFWSKAITGFHAPVTVFLNKQQQLMQMDFDCYDPWTSLTEL